MILLYNLGFGTTKPFGGVINRPTLGRKLDRIRAISAIKSQTFTEASLRRAEATVAGAILRGHPQNTFFDAKLSCLLPSIDCDQQISALACFDVLELESPSFQAVLIPRH